MERVLYDWAHRRFARRLEDFDESDYTISFEGVVADLERQQDHEYAQWNELPLVCSKAVLDKVKVLHKTSQR